MSKVKIIFEVEKSIDPIDFEWIMKRISRALEFVETDIEITDPKGNKIGKCAEVVK